MVRFRKLEFDEIGPGKDGEKGTPIRDANYFRQEAMKYWLCGDFETALRNYSRMLEKDNTSFEGWAGQVLSLIELGEYREAIVWADKALEMFPGHPDLFALKATACLRDAKSESAIIYSDNSMSGEKVTGRVWLARAEIFFERKSSIARDCISKAVSVAGDDAGLFKLEAGRLLRAKGEYVGAIGYLKEAVKAYPQSALAWYELGLAQWKMGYREAEESLKQAVRLRPGWDEPKESLRKVGGGFLRKLFGR